MISQTYIDGELIMFRSLIIVTTFVTAFKTTVSAGTVELPSTGDAPVYESDPSENFGWKGYIDWGQVAYYEKQGLIIFENLSGYSGITLNSAILNVFLIDASIYDDNRLRRVIEDWEEDTVTWNSRPDSTSQGELEFTAYPDIEWLDLDVTDLVQSWLDSTYPNYGFCFLRLDDLNNHSWAFCSKEYYDPAYYPKLTLDFTSPVESTSLGEIKAAFR